MQLCTLPTEVVESHTLEIKGWCKDEKELALKIAEASACLANASGGNVLVGISDKAGSLKFSFCPYSNIRPDWITQRIHDLTYPPVELRVCDVSDIVQEVTGRADKNAYLISVPKTNREGGHQIVGGLSKIRSGKECQPYYFSEDDRTKASVPGATLSDLSRLSIEWALEQHRKKHGVPKSHWETPYDFLVHTGLLERVTPERESASNFRVTLAALLLFGKEAALVRNFPGVETVLITPLGEKRFTKNLVESFRELCGSRGGLLSELCPSLPLEIITELISNAYVHRSYRVRASVIVRVSSGYLEIESPGSFPASITPDNLIYCTPIYRNFLLSEGARYVGICDKIGYGIDLIYKNVLSEGLGFPLFEGLQDKVIARVATEGSREFARFVQRRSQFLTELDEIMVLRFLWDKPEALLGEIGMVIQRGQRHALHVLEEVCRKNMIEPADGVSGRWRLRPAVREDIQNIFHESQLALALDLYGTGELVQP